VSGADVTGREPALARLLAALGRSPSPLSDLAAAVQKAMQAISGQALVQPDALSWLKQDLASLSTIVCLLAWREHRDNQRRAQQQGQQAAPLLRPEVLQGITTALSKVGRQLRAPAAAAAAGHPHPAPAGAARLPRHAGLKPAAPLPPPPPQVVLTADSASNKLCEATVSLLAHFAELELQAWPREMLVGQQGQQQLDHGSDDSDDSDDSDGDV
jgi:hypothetical protein